MAEQKNTKLIHAAEFMKAINDAESHEDKLALMKKYGTTAPLNMLLSLNFNDRIQLDLPEGLPEDIKIDKETHPDLMTPLGSQINRLKACVKGSNIPKFKKEQVFLQIVELIPPCDVTVLVACKDKKLGSLYPNITKELVQEVFPNYVL